MKQQVYSLFLLTLLFLITGCEKDFDVGYITGDTKMVVNCQIDNLRPIKIFVTESVSLLGTSIPKCITNAQVELYMNDSLLSVLPFTYTDSAKTFGGYVWPQLGKPGNTYSVKITHPKYGTVTATDFIPPMPVVTNYALIHYGDSTDNYTTRFNLHLLDDGAKQNYYRLNVWQWGRKFFVSDEGDTTITDYAFSSKSEIQVLLSDTVREYNSNLLFSDKSFNGQLKQIDFVARGADLVNTNEAYYLVELSEVSPAHYQYSKSLQERNDFNSGSGNNSTYSNIQNAYGIFMSHSIYQMLKKVK